MKVQFEVEQNIRRFKKEWKEKEKHKLNSATHKLWCEHYGAEDTLNEMEDQVSKTTKKLDTIRKLFKALTSRVLFESLEEKLKDTVFSLCEKTHFLETLRSNQEPPEPEDIKPNLISTVQKPKTTVEVLELVDDTPQMDVCQTTISSHKSEELNNSQIPKEPEENSKPQTEIVLNPREIDIEATLNNFRELQHTDDLLVFEKFNQRWSALSKTDFKFEEKIAKKRPLEDKSFSDTEQRNKKIKISEIS
eukprot:TRINITY_DN15903_c0_g1_i1.p1 TRINITY_DN15903_c0_g1~~TRINITY_DN15903_c0_g1_i1.p1  ORF type:complete len:248 (-),score=42.56 TRINITY_DN15903_c0_g1_i1:111-854(-)